MIVGQGIHVPREPDGSLVFRAGDVLVVSDDQTLRGRLAPELTSSGFRTAWASFSAPTPSGVDGAIIVDGRQGAKRAASLLQRLRPAARRSAIVLADPREPFVYRTIRDTCSAVVLYDPVDPAQVVGVLDSLLSRRKAS